MSDVPPEVLFKRAEREILGANETRKNSPRIFIAILGLIAVSASAAIYYYFFRSQPQNQASPAASSVTSRDIQMQTRGPESPILFDVSASSISINQPAKEK